MQTPHDLIMKADLILISDENSFFEGDQYFARESWPRTFQVVKDRYSKPGRTTSLSLLEFRLLTIG